MRVIAGSARSVPLLSPEGEGTRPTTDRIKETLFNIIRDDVYDARFLDLFAGSGQIGIEALSRGAKRAVFVEKNKKTAELIKKNLEKTKLFESAKVYRADVTGAIPQLYAEGEFDIIYMDPPYASETEEAVLKAIGEYGLLAEDGKIIVEAALDRRLDTEDLPFTVYREKSYKTNKHLFLERK